MPVSRHLSDALRLCKKTNNKLPEGLLKTQRLTSVQTVVRSLQRWDGWRPRTRGPSVTRVCVWWGEVACPATHPRPPPSVAPTPAHPGNPAAPQAPPLRGGSGRCSLAPTPPAGTY